MSWELILEGVKNAVLTGGAGCGKSELALSLAFWWADAGKNVHFFDLDQSKPLFRTRDLREQLERAGIHTHFEEQWADAPTMPGGIAPFLLDPLSFVIIDTGGGDGGIHLIGVFANILSAPETARYFVVNPYRPWEDSREGIAGTLEVVQKASHIRDFQFLVNPVLGEETTAEEWFDGASKAEGLLSPYASVRGIAVPEHLFEDAKGKVVLPLLPVSRKICYPWE